jgi:hypothetical protein
MLFNWIDCHGHFSVENAIFSDDSKDKGPESSGSFWLEKSDSKSLQVKSGSAQKNRRGREGHPMVPRPVRPVFSSRLGGVPMGRAESLHNSRLAMSDRWQLRCCRQSPRFPSPEKPWLKKLACQSDALTLESEVRTS